MLATIKSRAARLRRGDEGMETLQAVGLAFVGVLILLVIFVVYAAVRKNTADQTNTLIKLDYNSVKPTADKGSANLDEIK